MLSNAYFLAKFRFDTAENEPAKNLQNFTTFANFADPNPLTRSRAAANSADRLGHVLALLRRGLRGGRRGLAERARCAHQKRLQNLCSSFFGVI